MNELPFSCYFFLKVVAFGKNGVKTHFTICKRVIIGYFCTMKKGLLLLIVLLISLDMIWGQGCSQCRMMSEQSAELGDESFTSNINIGILYLMLIPYLLLMFLFRKRILRFFRKLFGKKTEDDQNQD